MDLVFPSIELSTDMGLGFEGGCQLTRMSVKYNEIIDKIRADHKGKFWLEEELILSRSEIQEFKRAVMRLSAVYYTLVLYTLEIYLPDHLVENFLKFGSSFCTDGRPFEQINVLIRQSYRMESRRFLT